MASQHKVLDMSENLGGSLVAASTTLLIFSWVAVGLRTYTRAVLMKAFQVDDWLMLVAQVIFTSMCAFVLAGVKVGVGRHNLAIRDENERVAALMWQALSIAAYLLGMMFIKLSIGIFLLRISVGLVYRYILWVSMVVITLCSLGIFLWDVFQCSPVEKQWDYRINDGVCASPNQVLAAAYAISVINVLSDWLYALLPLPMLWNVKMTKQAKTTVIIILGLGIFASVATLVRLKFLDAILNSEDLLYIATKATTWTMIEPGVAIVASSLATIRPLLRAMKIRGFQPIDTRSGSSLSTEQRGMYGGNNKTRDFLPRCTAHHPYCARNLSYGIGYGGQDLPVQHIRRSGGDTTDKGEASEPPPDLEKALGGTDESEMYAMDGEAEGDRASSIWGLQKGGGELEVEGEAEEEADVDAVLEMPDMESRKDTKIDRSHDDR